VAEFDHTIGFIGAGNMAEAFIGALIRSGLLPAVRISIADIDPRRRDALKHQYGVTVAGDNSALFQSCRVVVLAVKPQHIPGVLREVSARRVNRPPERKLVISIAAGVKIRQMEEILYASMDAKGSRMLPIVRVMPNTPALVLSAVSAMSANRFATAEDANHARLILQAVGDVMEFEEEALDAVTALSGSGPAYVYYLVESMIHAGVRVGLDRAAAAALTLATLKGAAKLLAASGEPAEELRRKVTSPGGTTAAALEVFETRGFQEIVVEAITAATRRARELSR
jgi:pyrroline-5-carboxylate reductase